MKVNRRRLLKLCISLAVPSAQSQLMMQSSGHIVQRPTQQIQIGGQTFTLAAAAPQQQLAMRPIDPQSGPGASVGI